MEFFLLKKSVQLKKRAQQETGQLQDFRLQELEHNFPEGNCINLLLTLFPIFVTELDDN